MKMKKNAALVLALLLCLSLCACSQETGTTVAVQSVGLITGMGSVGLNDKFAGVVEAGQTLAVEKDDQLQVKELLVAAGDRVEADQVLFTYDTDAISLELDKMRLELEQLKAAAETKTQQITDLEKEKAKAGKDEQLSYTLQIQELQIDLTENELNTKAKEKDIARMESFLEADRVLAPVAGRIQSINENGATDDFGNPKPYISILQTETYRIRGTINEQNAAALTMGMPVTIRSRMDQSVTWTGVIEAIDWESPVQNNSGYWGPSDEMTQSTKYPFHVSLDSDEGLMLGQHVYIEPGLTQEGERGLMLPAWCLNDADTDSPWVWAVDKNEKLEKRPLELGEYDPESDSWPVLSGLALSDYIAPPSEDCAVGASVTYYSESDFEKPAFEGDFGFEEGNSEGNFGFEEGGFEEGNFGFEEGGFEEDGFEGEYGVIDGGNGVITGGFIEELPAEPAPAEEGGAG